MRSMGTQQDLPVQILMLDDGLEPPAYATDGDAGADLRTAVDVVLAPGERALVPTGLALALPRGYVGLVHPRSGLAARHGVTIVNAPGTIDAGYRGEVKVCLLNTDRNETVRFTRGDRVAQLVIQRVEHAVFEIVGELPESVRGAGGFGSTGGLATAGPHSAAAPAPLPLTGG
ncbi:dUTP diphosphatase [Arthrobacter sp. NPDC092385]|uniref:dUTP diphosphatase n=1 Tax=Arthrobacter sp. NPDC092385 TaxID=3363943 RepID=UPI00380A4714